jgi:putative acetyltransferase
MKIKTEKIEKFNSKDYNEIIAVWESSVKTTHDFLKLEDFDFYRKVMPDFLSKVDLYVLRSENDILAFMGISNENLEMLFVSGKLRGKGYGKCLLETAITKYKIRRVDVNEQNRQAIGFYEKFGFKIISRSEKDSMNKDYPILHLSL